MAFEHCGHDIGHGVRAKVAFRGPLESSRDPLILGTVTILLLAVAVMACLAPARRAASIDPMEAVRHE